MGAGYRWRRSAVLVVAGLLVMASCFAVPGSTHPEGSAVDDPDYHDGRAGTDHVAYQITLPAGVDATKCTVEATLYYQAIPPSYLNARFTSAPDGDATRRLYYLASNLQLAGTSTENWKLLLASSRTTVARGPLLTSP